MRPPEPRGSCAWGSRVWGLRRGHPSDRSWSQGGRAVARNERAEVRMTSASMPRSDPHARDPHAHGPIGSLATKLPKDLDPLDPIALDDPIHDVHASYHVGEDRVAAVQMWLR